MFCFTFVLFSFRFCVCFNESYHSLSSTYVRHCKSLPLKDHFWRKRGTFTLSAKITGACLYTRRSITKSFSWSYKVKATSYRLRTDLTIIEMTFLFSSCRKKKKNPDRQFSIFYDALWWKLAYIFFRNEYTAWSCSPSVLLCFVFSFYEEELMRTLCRRSRPNSLFPSCLVRFEQLPKYLRCSNKFEIIKRDWSLQYYFVT